MQPSPKAPQYAVAPLCLDPHVSALIDEIAALRSALVGSFRRVQEQDALIRDLVAERDALKAAAEAEPPTEPTIEPIA